MSLALASRRAAISPAWVKNPLWRTARAVPSLDQPFADTKSLVDAVTGQSLVTFTRASSGTSVGSDGLLKTATTNYHPNSEDFSGATVFRGSVTTNVIAAPNGTITADLFTEDLQVGNHIVQSPAGTPSFVSGTPYTYSVFLKPNGRTSIRVYANQTATLPIDATFTLTGSGSVSVTLGTCSIQAVGDGWYRCSLSTTATATAASGISHRTSTATGDNTTGLYLWGAQLEQSSTVGEYIPTTSTINSAPRFDHNPTTGESLGLLVEEQRTNLATQSEALDASPWGVSALTVAANSTDTLSPDGVTYPEKFLETSATSNHTFFRAIGLSITAGAVYTASVFIKRIAGQFYQIIFDDNVTTNGGYVNVDLINGTITASANYGTGASIASSITRFGNGWFRISITSTAGSLATVGRVAVNTLTSGSQTQFPGFAGSTSNGFYLWGVQVEAGSFPTSYIPTTTATATRSADVASITGTAFSSWYRQDEGTVFCSFSRSALISSTGFANLWALSDDTASERHLTYNTGSSQTIDTVITDGGVAQAVLIATGAITANSIQAHSFAYKVNDFAAARNAGTVDVDASGTLPSVNRLYVGANHAGGGQFSGYIRRLTYWPARLPNSTLQAITQ